MSFKSWFQESFDSVSHFLLNPEHSNKTWEQLVQEFESSGGKLIGSGRYGQIFEHPSWNYVLKMFPHDSYYTSFVRFAYRNPHPSFPKFYGPPQRVLPFYRRSRSSNQMYLVRLEKLQPLNPELANFIVKYLDTAIYYLENKKSGLITPEFLNTNKVIARTYAYIEDYLKRYPKLNQLFEGWNLLMKSSLRGASDVHVNNFMQRENGDIVIIDPFWEGSNPYADYKRTMDMETDVEPIEEPLDVPAGRFPIKKRKKRYKPPVSFDDDDIPF